MRRSRKLDKGSNDRLIIIRMIKSKLPSKVISKVTGYSLHVISAIRAHITMGTYGEN